MKHAAWAVAVTLIVLSDALAADWSQWGGSPTRNNTPAGQNIPAEWNIGEFDEFTNKWLPRTARNIKWGMPLGSQTYGNPIVAGGRVFVGTNNASGYLKRFPATIDMGVLLCFDEKDGCFLWQHSSPKMAIGREHDWPMRGVCSTPLVEGDRLWYVNNRSEVVCLDTEGYHDDQDDGPATSELRQLDEADVVWSFDMIKELGTWTHNMASCSITSAGNLLFVNTSNGVNEGHTILPALHAPSFMAMDKHSGKVVWTDNSPGENILHGQWSSPSYAVLGGVPQVLFGGGDGWLYSFDPAGTADGKSKLLWQFDCNPKRAQFNLGGRADRNHIIGMPVIYEDRVYVGVGEDPEHGEGVGHFYCIDPTKRGDVSAELVVDPADPARVIPHRRMQAALPGEIVQPNPNSAQVWHYEAFDHNRNGKIEFEERMHRTCSTAAIKDNLLFITDFSGLVHCLNAKTGLPHWTFDMLAAHLVIAAHCRWQGLHRRRGRRHCHLRAVRRAEAAGRNQHGQFRLHHANRGQRGALHRQQTLPVCHRVGEMMHEPAREMFNGHSA